MTHWLAAVRSAGFGQTLQWRFVLKVMLSWKEIHCLRVWHIVTYHWLTKLPMWNLQRQSRRHDIFHHSVTHWFWVDDSRKLVGFNYINVKLCNLYKVKIINVITYNKKSKGTWLVIMMSTLINSKLNTFFFMCFRSVYGLRFLVFKMTSANVLSIFWKTFLDEGKKC